MQRLIKVSGLPNLSESLEVKFVIPPNSGDSISVVIVFPEDIIKEPIIQRSVESIRTTESLSPGKESSQFTYGTVPKNRTVVPLSSSSIGLMPSRPTITNNLSPSPIMTQSVTQSNYPEEMNEEEAANNSSQGSGKITETPLMPEEYGLPATRMRVSTSMSNNKTKPKVKVSRSPPNTLETGSMLPYEPPYKCQPAFDIHGKPTGECTVPPKKSNYTQKSIMVGGQSRQNHLPPSSLLSQYSK